jgi:hypothetical protein
VFSALSVVVTIIKEGCCCLPAIAVDCPALKNMQIAADGRGGRVALSEKCLNLIVTTSHTRIPKTFVGKASNWRRLSQASLEMTLITNSK